MQRIPRHLSAQVARRAQLSHDSFQVTLQLQHSHALDLRPGQHIKVHFQEQNTQIQRAYTPISQVYQGNLLDLLVKSYGSTGTVSTYLDNLALKENLILSGPYGNLVYQGNDIIAIRRKNEEGQQEVEERSYGKHLMLAAGSGITPMLQIIQWAYHNGESLNKFSLLFANKSKEDVLLLDRLQALQKEGMHLHFVLDHPDSTFPSFQGYITQEMFQQVMSSAEIRPEHTLAYICGPAQFQRLCIRHLRGLGFSLEHIYKF